MYVFILMEACPKCKENTLFFEAEWGTDRPNVKFCDNKNCDYREEDTGKETDCYYVVHKKTYISSLGTDNIGARDYKEAEFDGIFDSRVEAEKHIEQELRHYPRNKYEIKERAKNERSF